MTTAMLEIRDLHAYYGKSHVLHGVDMSVGEGEIVSLLGRNGVGRSTTVKATMGQVQATGSIKFKGEEIIGEKAFQIAYRGLGYVPENRDIFPTLTVEQNLILGEKKGKKSRWTLDDMYQLFPRLKERQNTAAGVLSGGEQQMLTLCRTLMGDPDLIMIDEPTEGLAPIIVEELLKALGVITRAGGICSIIVEQNAQKILGLADRVVILERGAIVHDAASAELKADPAVLERFLGVSGAAAH
jgi:branched-chain amino acid transport system ATP-binding protein